MLGLILGLRRETPESVAMFEAAPTEAPLVSMSLFDRVPNSASPSAISRLTGSRTASTGPSRRRKSLNCGPATPRKRLKINRELNATLETIRSHGVSRPEKVLKESYFKNIEWARTFVSGPLDPAHNM